MTVQNGLGNDDVIANVVPRSRIAVGMTNYPSDLVSPGHVATHGKGEISLWTASGADEPRLHYLVAALDAAGLACRADPAVRAAIWEKVAFNAAFNALAAITRLTVGGIADAPGGRDFVARVAAETAAVARAAGHGVDEDSLAHTIDMAFASHRGHKPSMLQDILAGRATEIATINEAVVREGKRLGQPTPLNDTLSRIVRLIGG